MIILVSRAQISFYLVARTVNAVVVLLLGEICERAGVLI
jgi:hypothetical protein